MIYFLYGPDTYRSQKKLNDIIRGYEKIHKNGLDLKLFEGNSFTFNDFKTDVEQVSLFQEKKLIILRNVFSNNEFRDKFLENKKDFIKTDNIIVFHQGGDLDKRKSLYKFLRKKNKNQEFQEFVILDKNNLSKWIKIQVNKLKGSIEEGALNELIVFVGNDLWRMENEISKLVSFKNGEIITAKDVRSLVSPKIETNIFKTIEAIAFKDKKKALKLFQLHLDNGENALYLLSMIAYQFKTLLILKDLEENNIPFRESGLHPFVVKKSLFLLSKFTLLDLKTIYREILKIDGGVKSGKMDARTAIDLLIVKI